MILRILYFVLSIQTHTHTHLYIDYTFFILLTTVIAIKMENYKTDGKNFVTTHILYVKKE